MKWAFKDICSVDVSKAAELLQSLPDEVWRLGRVRQLGYENHKNARAIPLKWGLRVQPDINDKIEAKKYFGRVVNTNNRNEYSEFWDEHKDTFEPLIHDVLSQCEYKNPKVARILVTTIPAHDEIKPHVDGMGSLNDCNRLHIPIITNDKAMMIVEEEKKHFSAGSVFELNNIRVHAATNPGDKERVHIILDIYDGDNKWL